MATPTRKATESEARPKRKPFGDGHSASRDARYRAKTKRKKKLFLAKLAMHGTPTKAALCARITPKTAYVWKKADPDFEAAWIEAMEAAADVAESAMYDRHVYGVAEPIFYKGRKVGERREFDTRAGEFWLKGRRAGVFGDRITHVNSNGGPLVPSLTAVQVMIHDGASIAALEQQRALPAPKERAVTVTDHQLDLPQTIK